MSRTPGFRSFGRPTSRPQFTLRGNAPTFASPFMPCGIHKRPINVPAQPLEYDDRPRKPVQKYRRVLKDGEKRGECMCDYHDYPRLRREREHAEETVAGKPFRFADLPTEIRTKIFGEAILFDGVIEFCPEPYQYSGYGRLKGLSKEHGQASSHQIATVGHKIAAAGTLMRTCKQFNEDITEDFYSSNEFRFTNVTGWTTLDIFLHMIGLAKVAMLRKLSVSHPHLNVLPGSLSTLDTFAGGQLYIRDVGGFRDAPGFSTYSEKRWFDDMKTPSKDPLLVLEKLGKLRELRWILPAFARHGVVPDLESPIDTTKLENLKLTFAGVHTKTMYTFYTYNDPRVLMYSPNHKAKELAEDYTEQTNQICKYEDHWLDDETGEWVNSVLGQTRWVEEDLYDGVEGLFDEV